MSDLRDLYQEVILDHSRKPRNFGSLEGAKRAEGFNPLCGDEITLFVDVDDTGVVRDVRFQGKGCAISTASASLMTETVKGKTCGEAEVLFERFHGVLTDAGEPDLDAIGKLAVLAGVREFPMRVKCASLAWHTLRAALEGHDAPVTTE